jgi:uncharacterized damage-inducible protein DinB
MTIAETLLPEFDQEMATTRRVIERVPLDNPAWKPHEKSFSVAHLTQLVATMPGWITRTIRDDAINLKSGPGYSDQTAKSLLEQFDSHVREARQALSAADDARFDTTWQLKMGDHVLFTQKRGEGVRQHINHLVHHRGQLTVYLRMLNAAVPSIYGPTADEPWGK